VIPSPKIVRQLVLRRGGIVWAGTFSAITDVYSQRVFRVKISLRFLLLILPVLYLVTFLDHFGLIFSQLI